MFTHRSRPHYNSVESIFICTIPGTYPSHVTDCMLLHMCVQMLACSGMMPQAQWQQKCRWTAPCMTWRQVPVLKWCPKDNPMRSLLGALKSRVDPVPLTVFPVHVTQDGGVWTTLL